MKKVTIISAIVLALTATMASAGGLSTAVADPVVYGDTQAKDRCWNTIGFLCDHEGFNRKEPDGDNKPFRSGGIDLSDDVVIENPKNCKPGNGPKGSKGKKDRGPKGNASKNNGKGGNSGKGGKDRGDNGKGNGKGRR